MIPVSEIMTVIWWITYPVFPMVQWGREYPPFFVYVRQGLASVQKTTEWYNTVKDFIFPFIVVALFWYPIVCSLSWTVTRTVQFAKWVGKAPGFLLSVVNCVMEVLVWQHVKQIYIETGAYKKAKVIGHRAGGKGVIRERLLPGLEIDADNTMPAFQARIWILFEGEYRPIGHLFRCGNKQVDWLVTAAHNVTNFKSGKAFLQDSNGVELDFDFGGFQFIDGVDVAVKPYNITASNGFSMTKAKMADRISQRSEMVKIVGTNGNSMGPLRHDEDIFGQVVVSASTAKGFSGAPYYTNKTVYGVHYGAFAEKNVGYDITYVLALFLAAETDYWYQKYVALDSDEVKAVKKTRRVDGDDVLLRLDGAYKRISQKEYDLWEQLYELESYEEAGSSDEPRRQKVYGVEKELEQVRKKKEKKQQYEEECVDTSTFVDVEQKQENSNSPASAAVQESSEGAATVSSLKPLTQSQTPEFVSAADLLKPGLAEAQPTVASEASAGPGPTPAPRKSASGTTSGLRVRLEADFMQQLKRDISATKVKGQKRPGGKETFLHEACLKSVDLGLVDFQKAMAQMATIISPERLRQLPKERQDHFVERYALFQQVWAEAQAEWKTRTQTD